MVGIVLALMVFLLVGHYPERKQTNAEAKRMTLHASFKTVSVNPQTWWLFAYAFLIWGPVTVFSALWGTDYLKTLYNIGTVEASQFSWYFWLSMAVASPAWGYITDKIGQRGPVMRVSSALGFVASVIMIAYPEISMPMMRLMLVFFGVAVSGHIISFAVVKDINQPGVVSTASGVNNMGVVLGGVILQPLVGSILDFIGPDHIVNLVPIYSLHAYAVALSIMPICFLLGYIIARWGIKETYCHSQYDH